MPRKGDRHVPQCTQCTSPVKLKITNGVFKGYGRTCRKHFGYHHKPGKNHHNATKNGRRILETGYVQVLDPRRKKARKRGSNYIMEHRLLMEEFLGRRLKRSEVVHHLNGIRDDNRRENLVIIGPKEKHESRTLIKAMQTRILLLESQLSVAVSPPANDTTNGAIPCFPAEIASGESFTPMSP